MTTPTYLKKKFNNLSVYLARWEEKNTLVFVHKSQCVATVIDPF